MSGVAETRIVIYTMIVGGIAYDLFCVLTGRSTISAQVRAINHESGWLLALCLAALWLHFFGGDILDFFWRR